MASIIDNIELNKSLYPAFISPQSHRKNSWTNILIIFYQFQNIIILCLVHIVMFFVIYWLEINLAKE